MLAKPSLTIARFVGELPSVMGAPTVVFDLDGTLVDSAPDLVATLNTVFAQEGLPPVPYYIARNLVGGGARSMIECSLAAEGRRLAAAEMDRLRQRVFPNFTALVSSHPPPLPNPA